MITLRPLEPEDLAALYETENAPDLWSRTSAPAPVSRYALRTYIAEAKTLHDCGEQRLAIVLTDEAGESATIGFVDLTDFSPLSRRAEVSLTLLSAHRHRGHGLAALRLLEDYALRLARMHQLYAIVSEDNPESCRLFEKAGYTPCGTLPDWHYDGLGYRKCTFYAKILKKKTAQGLVE